MRLFLSLATVLFLGGSQFITPANAAGGLCFSDANCLPTESCVRSGSGAGECRERQLVGECRENADCNWPKICVGWYCH